MILEDEGIQEEAAPPPVEEGAPLWTVTFGDMMSLLLTFFILMYSMSELKQDRFLLASKSLSDAIGGTADVAPEVPAGVLPDSVDQELEPDNPGLSEGAVESEVETGAEAGDIEGPWLESVVDAYSDMIARKLEEFVRERGLEATLSVLEAGEGVYLRIQSTALFESGSATVIPATRWIVDELAAVTRDIDVRLIVSGHADNQPISSAQFPSNWELSAARAAGVARAMVEGGHPPTRVRVESFGEFKPVASNETPQGRAQNRRVELFYARDDIISALKALAVAVAQDPDSAAAVP